MSVQTLQLPAPGQVLRIAFTSCFSAGLFPQQPVWTQIAHSAPQLLLLLGDSIYIDEDPGQGHPKEMQDYAFLQHVARLYRRQLAQPQFDALRRAVPCFAIWDDHDFLWNECYEERAIRRKRYAGLIRASNALFKAYCQDLEGRTPFPASDSDARLWAPQEPPPGYRCIALDVQGLPPLRLHLSDGRSWRVDRQLLGAGQRQQIERAMDEAPPGSVHLLATGSVLERHKGDHWGQFEDLDWLRALARRHRIAALSGDIHDVDFHALSTDAAAPGTFSQLYDFTASGAAIRKGISAGSACQHYALLEIGAETLECRWTSFGQPADMPVVRLRLSDWTRL